MTAKRKRRTLTIGENGKAAVVRERAQTHITISPAARAAGLAEVERRNAEQKMPWMWNLSRLIDDDLLQHVAIRPSGLEVAAEPTRLMKYAIDVLSAAEKAIVKGDDLSEIVVEVRAIRKSVVEMLAAMRTRYDAELDLHKSIEDWQPSRAKGYDLIRINGTK